MNFRGIISVNFAVARSSLRVIIETESFKYITSAVSFRTNLNPTMLSSRGVGNGISNVESNSPGRGKIKETFYNTCEFIIFVNGPIWVTKNQNKFLRNFKVFPGFVFWWFDSLNNFLGFMIPLN